jgi:hypothetical protein
MPPPDPPRLPGLAGVGRKEAVGAVASGTLGSLIARGFSVMLVKTSGPLRQRTDPAPQRGYPDPIPTLVHKTSKWSGIRLPAQFLDLRRRAVRRPHAMVVS